MAQHDLVIRGGLVVDGSGAEGRSADVAIDGGRIAKVGAIAGAGAVEIDARGHVVTPGFVDLHTHLDAQIGWDPDLTPVSWHGVTTALLGNCGVTFAPCRPTDREFLAGMMETVEDIPRDAILTGLPWNWEDYGGYLDALDAIRPGINVAGLVGHAAVRTYVMGERAFEATASDAEVRQMADIVTQAMDRGALGFSSNRYEPHKGPDGRSIPGTFADPSELVEIGKAVSARSGVMQLVGATADVLHAVADRAGARLLFSWGLGPDRGAGARSAAYLDQICDGRDMTAICQVRGTGFMFGLQSHLPFKGEAWARLRAMPFSERLTAIDDEAFAYELTEGGVSRLNLDDVYWLGTGETPSYIAARSDTVRRIMHETGETFPALFLRLSRESAGRGFFNLRLFCQDLDELSVLFGSPNIFPGLGDAGAHVSQIMDADWATFTLGYWIRDRGRYSLGEGVRRMTSGPARVIGLKDRGLLWEGMRADINVIDLDRVSTLQPEIVRDFPGGAPRLVQRANGYKATIVNGQVNVLDDAATGARAGMVLRHAT